LRSVLLLDLHSYYLYPVIDICMGNCNGSTCNEHVINSFSRAFLKSGFSVSTNEVLTGGYITRHYGSVPNVESLQIEIRYPSYLNGDYFGEVEITEWDCEKFRNAKERLRLAFNEVINNLEM